MLDLKFVRNNLEKVRDMLEKRHTEVDIDKLEKLDRERRDLIGKVEALNSEKKKLGKEIGMLKREGKDATEVMEVMKKVSEEQGIIENKLKEIEEEYFSIMKTIPNMFHESVPTGKDESSNIEIRKWGEPSCLTFKAKPHWEIGEQLDIIDFERAAKLTGSRFAVMKGLGARL